MSCVFRTFRSRLKNMVSFRFKGTLLSCGLAFLGLGFYSEPVPDYVAGLSPMASASRQFEEGVFSRFEKERKIFQLETERKVRIQIAEVISNFRTGLPKGNYEKVPDWIIAESKRYGYDPLLITAVIVTESSFYNWAKSNRGALGLMQIQPATGIALARETQVKWEGNPTLFDPSVNIQLGAYYLNKLLERFGDWDLALEAYNHGPSRLARYLKKGYKPRQYSRKVFEKYKMMLSQSA